MKAFLPIAGFLGFFSIVFFALGAHHYSHLMGYGNLMTFLIAAALQLIHSLVFLMLGLYGYATHQTRKLLAAAGYLLFAGVILFCGSIYLTTMFDIHSLAFITPIGGFCLLFGWAIIFIAGIYYYNLSLLKSA